MPALSDYMKQKVVKLSENGKALGKIIRELNKEGIYPNRSSISKFLKKYLRTGTIKRLHSGGAPKKLTPEMRKFIDDVMKENDETTLCQLRDKLQLRFDITVSKTTIDRERRSLGWTFKSAAYCQVVREANRIKRLNFALDHPNLAQESHDMIFTDETSCELQCHRLRCARKKGQAPKPKPRPKHPVKVHVWAGISKRGATQVVIFEGIMDRFMYVDILDRALKPFINAHFQDGHRFIQDNDPKHTSRYAKRWMTANGINWFPTPAESPDLNPIEMLWHELKEFLRNVKKPKNKEDLVNGIKEFWRTVDATKCSKYINHLRKVVPAIIAKDGRATGM